MFVLLVEATEINRPDQGKKILSYMNYDNK